MGAGGSEVADIALADSDVRNLFDVHDLSKAAVRIAGPNYHLAIGNNLEGAVLGAAGKVANRARIRLAAVAAPLLLLTLSVLRSLLSRNPHDVVHQGRDMADKTRAG